MIIWGSGGESKDLGVMETRRCDTCEKDRPFKLVLQYRYGHIWYLFKWVSERKYVLQCDVCHHGWQVDTKQVESNLKTNPIPFATRYGLAFLAGVIGIAVLAGVVSGQQKAAEDHAYLSAPRVGDLYVTDMTKLLRNPQSAPMYGIMRVSAVLGDRVEFVVSNMGYNKALGPKKDISSGKASRADYYGMDKVVIRTAELKGMLDRGTIYEIRRN
jgi:hypothetical protein